jgi:hypothetical protein
LIPEILMLIPFFKVNLRNRTSLVKSALPFKQRAISISSLTESYLLIRLLSI